MKSAEEIALLNSQLFERENMNSTKISLIQQAQRIHGKGQKIYHCGKCDYTSYERQSVRDHRKVTHERGTLSQFKCDLCKYSSREERYLIQHMRASHVTKPAIEQGPNSIENF